MKRWIFAFLLSLLFFGCNNKSVPHERVVIVAVYSESHIVGTFGKAVELLPKTTIKFKDGTTYCMHGIRGAVGDTIVVRWNDFWWE